MSTFAGYLARNLYAALQEASAAIIIQKYMRKWILRNAYVQLYAASLLIQSCVRGFAARQKFLYRKENKAATIIQVNIYSLSHPVRLLHFIKLSF